MSCFLQSIQASGLVLLEAILCGALLLYFPVSLRHKLMHPVSLHICWLFVPAIWKRNSSPWLRVGIHSDLQFMLPLTHLKLNQSSDQTLQQDCLHCQIVQTSVHKSYCLDVVLFWQHHRAVIVRVFIAKVCMWLDWQRQTSQGLLVAPANCTQSWPLNPAACQHYHLLTRLSHCFMETAAWKLKSFPWSLHPTGKLWSSW